MDRAIAVGQLHALKLLLPIIGEFCRGADVQYRFDDDPELNRWYDCADPSFDTHMQYRAVTWRVKPIPVEATVWVCRVPHTEYDTHPDDEIGVMYKKGDMQLEAPPEKYESHWTKHVLREVV